jgi:hypothetical protein
MSRWDRSLRFPLVEPTLTEAPAGIHMPGEANPQPK